MPSNKVFATTILCAAVVLSVWLISKKATLYSGVLTTETPSISTTSYKNDAENTNDEWKKILNDINTKDEKVINLIKNPESFDNTTLTAQISKDFLAQYLQLKQGGKTLTEAEKTQIVSNLLSSKTYQDVVAPVYIALNLHITSRNDSTTEKKYEDSVNLALKTRSSQVTGDPILLLNQIVGPNSASALNKIDNTITAGRGLIEDLLKIEVPSRAVSVHLEFLNSVSRLVSDVEAMREISNDPVRSLAGIKQYGPDILTFQNSFKKLNTHFAQN